MRARKARLPDANAIHGLIRSLSYDGTLLPRTFAEIYENVRDFTVVETDEGEFLGCGALHLYGPHLAEIRSIAVSEKGKKQGAGGHLVEALLEEAESHCVPCVCLLDFFSASALSRSTGLRCQTKSTKIAQIVRD
jgi:amino-acid N-acetyltransferase